MHKVGTTERTSNERRDTSAIRGGHLDIVANVKEYLMMAKFVERKLTPVAVGRQILESVQSLAKQTIGFEKVFRATTLSSTATQVNHALERVTDQGRASRPTARLVCKVVLHARAGVNLELAGINRSAKSRVVLPSVLAISIALGVVEVLLGKIDTKTFAGNFELCSCVAMGKEAEDHDNVENGLLGHLGQSSHIHGLTVVAKPVAKVDALDIQTSKLATAAEKAARLFDKLSENVLNVSVTESLALHVGERRNVAGTKGVGPRNSADGKEDDKRSDQEEGGAG